MHGLPLYNQPASVYPHLAFLHGQGTTCEF